MLKNYLKIALRNLAKNKTFVLINILGLGISIAWCIVAYLNWQYNATYDGHHERADEIYRVNFMRDMGGRSIQNGSCPMPLAVVAKLNIPQIEESVRYMPSGANFKLENELFFTGMAGVDPAFLKLFTFDFIEGQATSIGDNRTVVIEETLKAKYWPDKEQVVGEVITLVDGDTKHELKVGGVFREQAPNSSFQQEAYINFEALAQIQQVEVNNWANFNSTFVHIPDADQVAIVEEQLADYVQVQNLAKDDFKVAHYYLDPFEGMAVRAEKEGTWNHWFSQSLPSAAAVAPGIMALLLLLIACFNFTNTSIAIANRRIKEIGIRKVMGSAKSQIILQFWGENLLLTGLALLLGILLAAFFVPMYSSMWVFLDIKFNLFQNLPLVGFLFALLFFTAIIAGSYPALYISKFQPTDIFRSTLKFSGTNIFTRSLLTLQFAISLMAIICGFVFAQNAKYQNDYDLGFEVEGRLFAYVDDGDGYRRFHDALVQNPKILKIAGGRHNMTSSWYTDPLKAEDKELDVNIFDVGADYLETIGATVLAGRNFKENSDYDADHAVIINEELARLLEWDNPIDQRIVLRDSIELSVVGVVKDIFQEGALWEPIEPMVLRAAAPERYRFLVVEVASRDMQATKAFMDEQWKTLFPDRLSTVTYMDEEKVESHEVNANIRTMFLFLAFVAALLSIIGLFSMVSMNINKKLKEIGIRKILGAPMKHIAMKISKEFVIILIVSCVLGSVGGFFLSEMLMESIWTYFTPIQIGTILTAVSLLLGTSAFTVGRMIHRAASRIPAELLVD